MKLGIMVPLTVSILFYKEMPTKIQTVGFLLAIFSIILINTRNKEEEMQVTSTLKTKLELIFVLLGCGMADGMSKIYQESGSDRFEELFLIFTFVIAFVLSLVLIIIKKEKITKNEIICGCFLGIPNYFSARFLLKALGELRAVIVYPTFSIGTIAVVTLTGILVFKEKLTRIQLFAIALIAIAVALLN